MTPAKPKRRVGLSSVSVDLERLQRPERRTAQINLRLTPTELTSIRETAKFMKLSVSDYIVGLHQQALEAIFRTKGR